MKTLISTVTLMLCFAVAAAAASDYRVLVLGTGQDAGVPQIGCASAFCKKAWKDKALHRMVSSIAVLGTKNDTRLIFDATPDLPGQLQLIKTKSGNSSNHINGIFLTHAHIGHYTGLMYLGFESMNAKAVPVYAMPRMSWYLRNNGPWSQLVSKNNISINDINDQKEVMINEDLSVTPFLVPHRDEFSETVGYRIASKRKSVIFLPDIDKWEKWKTNLEDLVRKNDILFLDATFFADGEIPRPIADVPHPFVSETMARLRSLPKSERSKVYFIHFNHSNPLIQGDVKALSAVREKGFNVAEEGTVLEF